MYEEERFDDSIEWFSKAILLSENDVSNYSWRARAYRKCRKYFEAMKDFKSAFQISDKIIYKNYYEETYQEMKDSFL